MAELPLPLVLASALREITDSDEYDTDLDNGENDAKLPDRNLESVESVGKSMNTYRRSCKKLGICISTAVADQLDGSELILTHRNIGPSGAQALAVALATNKSLSCIDLADSGLHGEGAVHIVEALLVNVYITRVNLSNNFLGSEGAMAIGELVRRSKIIRHLDVSGNNFKDYDIDYIATGIKDNDQLVELNLSRNSIGENSAAKLGSALANNNSIEKIDMSWNHIRRKGAVAICKGIQVNYCITFVNLSWNGFGYEGALAVGELLRHNRYLLHLDVSENRFNWQAAELMARGIKHNETLEVLKLGGNPLTTTGCMDIIGAVSHPSCRIRFLSLKGVPVTQEFEFLALAIKGSREFTYKHGGIVNSHDVLGERHDKKLDPMHYVINYMKERGLRPTELFRTFDKTVEKHISAEMLAARLKKSGITLQKYEMNELIAQIEQADLDDKSYEINYKKMSRSVTDQIEKERREKIEEREREKRLRKYHKEILTEELPTLTEKLDQILLFKDLNDEDGSQSEISSGYCLGQLDNMQKFKQDKLVPLTFQPNKLKVDGKTKQPALMSMAAPLGSKAKAFGTSSTKRKGKRKGKGRKGKKHV